MSVDYDIQDLEVETLDTGYEETYEEEDDYVEGGTFGDYDAEDAERRWGSKTFEELLAEMEDLVDSAKRFFFSKKKRVVDGFEINTLAKYMQDKFPAEFSRSTAIIAERDRIISEANATAESTVSSAKATADDTVKRADAYYRDAVAKAKSDAQAIIAQAQAQAHEMVQEHSITRMAREESERIKAETQAQTQQAIAAATQECAKLKSDTVQYCAGLVQAAHTFVNNGLSSYQSIAKSSLDSIAKTHTGIENEFANLMNVLGQFK